MLLTLIYISSRYYIIYIIYTHTLFILDKGYSYIYIIYTIPFSLFLIDRVFVYIVYVVFTPRSLHSPFSFAVGFAANPAPNNACYSVVRPLFFPACPGAFLLRQIAQCQLVTLRLHVHRITDGHRQWRRGHIFLLVI